MSGPACFFFPYLNSVTLSLRGPIKHDQSTKTHHDPNGPFPYQYIKTLASNSDPPPKKKKNQ